jgi:CBS domain-containing protein
MAESGFTRFPVLDPRGDGKIVGMVALNDLLHARTRNLEDERARERVLRIRMPFGRHAKNARSRLQRNQVFATDRHPTIHESKECTRNNFSALSAFIKIRMRHWQRLPDRPVLPTSTTWLPSVGALQGPRQAHRHRSGSDLELLHGRREGKSFEEGCTLIHMRLQDI